MLISNTLCVYKWKIICPDTQLSVQAFDLMQLLKRSNDTLGKRYTGQGPGQNSDAKSHACHALVSASKEIPAPRTLQSPEAATEIATHVSTVPAP